MRSHCQEWERGVLSPAQKSQSQGKSTKIYPKQKNVVKTPEANLNEMEMNDLPNSSK